MSEYIEVGQPLQFTDPNTPTRVGEIVENVSDIYNIPSPRLGMQVFVKSEKKTYTITGLKEAVIGGERVPNAKVDTFEAVKSQVEEIDNNFAEMREALAGGSFVVGVANLANAVKAGAVTFEMLDGKLRLSVSVVDDLETANTLMPLSANQGKILKELIDTINGTGEGSTDKKITDAIAALVDSAPENLNTLRELAEWIENHGAEMASIFEAINVNAKNLAETNKNIANQLIATPTANSVEVVGRNEQSMRINFEGNIPAATTETAGVMSAEDKMNLDNTDTSKFINAIYMYSNELSALPEDCFLKSVLDYEVIEGAYIQIDGMIAKGDYGNIIIIKPKPSTQYIHIKSRLDGKTVCFLGYANTVDATTVKPILSTSTDENINADWYIKPVTYLYVYVAKNTPTLESIDGFNLVQTPTVEQVADITSDVTSIFGTLPLQEETIPFTYKNGYIDRSGKVFNDNSFNNSLAVYDLEGLSRVKIKVKAVISENYTTASFYNSNTPTSSSLYSPIIKTQSGVVTEIVTDVIYRYLFVYVGTNAQGASELKVSKVSIAPTELVSKDELLEVENNITNELQKANNKITQSLIKKVDKKLGDNLFDKDSPLIIKGALLGSTGGVYTADYTTKFCVTHYIRVEAGKSYIANYSSGDSEIRLCVVDESKANLLLVINKTNGPEYKFTAPEGSAYVRMAIPISNIDSFIFNEGTEVIQDAYYEDKPVFHSEYNPNTVMPWKGKTIAMYGDSITELCGNSTVGATSWGGYLISALYAKGIVRGWGGTPLIHSGWNNSTTGTNKHWFNSVGEKVAVGTEGGIEINVAGMCDWKRIITQFPTIIKDTIDAVILMGGTNDFRYHEIGDTEYIVRDTLPESTTKIDVDWFNSEYYSGGDFDVTKVQGAVCSAILKLQTWMPNAVIIVATQLSGYWPESGINGTHQLVSDKSGLTEGEFALKIAEAARYMSVPVIDINGLTGINQWNRTRFITDNVHPYSIAGNKAMARVFIGEFSRIIPNF